jgi:alpha-1,2-mannosyltransferase
VHLPTGSTVRHWLSQRGRGPRLAVFCVALVPRLGFVLHGGGLGGTYKYDPGVYYAASTALLNGRLPYRDYVLLHPPGIALAMTPFAAAGQAISDHAGFILATLAFIAVGSINAVLVRSVALRMGLGSRAALAGGLFYAVWVGAVGSEYLIRLEVLGNFLLLLGLRAYLAKTDGAATRPLFLAGLALGAATATKLWFVVPVGIVLAFEIATHRSWARSRAFILGAIASSAAIAGPFFVAAPRSMWRMLVLDQLGRPDTHRLIWRLGYMSSASVFHQGSSTITRWCVVAAVTLVIASMCVAAWRAPCGQLFVVLLVAQIAVLVLAPAYFPFYNDFFAAPLAIVVAATCHVIVARVPSTVQRRAGPAVVTALAAVVVAGAASAIYLPEQAVLPFPQQLTRAVSASRCVMSDSPIVLIELNVLTRDLRNGCPNWVDVSGRTYGHDATYRHGQLVSRAKNRKWQRNLTRYLYSGDTLILYRPHATGIGRELRHKLAATPILANESGLTVYCTRPTTCHAANGS